MSRTVLYPMTVSVKVVKTATEVPTLVSAPFGGGATLEAGVHVHWALPDSLTKAEMMTDAGPQGAVFPAVPDLWLVVRLNAGVSSAKPSARRTWRAWVVDSVAGSAVPLASWKLPVREPGKVHTFAGMLPDAAVVKRSGKGFFQSSLEDGADPTVFSPFMAAYYPATRKRFGFYDDVKDIPAAGNLSYMVVGWHSSDRFDPVAAAGNARSTLDRWKAVGVTQWAGHDLRPAIDLDAAAPVTPGFRLPVANNLQADPAILKATAANQPLAANQLAGTAPVWKTPVLIKTGAQLPVERLQSIQRLVARSGSVDASRIQLKKMQTAFPLAGVDMSRSIPPQWQFAGATIYHGAVVWVPLDPQAAVAKPITNAQVTLWPNVQRSLADLASASSGDDRSVNAAEMLFAGVQGGKSSTGGVLDMPAATHAATFQSVPGAPKIYLRLDVDTAAAAPAPATLFSVGTTDDLSTRQLSGYWPGINLAKKPWQVDDGIFQRVPNIPSKFPPPAPAPVEPTGKEKDDFRTAVRKAFDDALATASTRGKTADDHLLYVFDNRPNARSLHLGQTTKQTGSDTAGWWIDVSLDADLDELLKTTAGARVSMPTADNLYELPGPRWYRPWSPQLRVQGLGRSYKFGFNGRFMPGDKVKVRRSGDTLVSLRVGSQTKANGSQLIDSEASLNVPGLPQDVVALLRETGLLDPESTGLMSGSTAGRKVFESAMTATWLSRSPDFDASVDAAVEWTGEQPSPLALWPWNDPVDPLFADTNCTLTVQDPASFELPESEVELRPVKNGAAATGVAVPLTERVHLNLTVASTLKSVLVSNITIDNLGHTVPAINGKKIKTTIETLDVMSAALLQTDTQLFAKGLRGRAGVLKLERMSVVDMFGLRREYTAPSTPKDQSTPVTTLLTPRYPFWSRFGMRLQSAADPTAEATPQSGPICGMLVPDFLEHTLEVFDANGEALGQFQTDPPLLGLTAANNSQAQRPVLNVSYRPHPWLPQGPDPFGGITNPTLRQVVTSIAAQPYTVPAGVVNWAETGLSAMLRVIDTVRTTFDPTAKPNSHRVDLIGTPILVMVARLDFRGTDTTQDALIGRNAAPPIAAVPAVPPLRVRLGDAIRPDDGVLGIFVPGSTPAAGRFAPVSAKAAPNALVTAFNPDIHATNGTTPATHPFVTGAGRTAAGDPVAAAESVIALSINQSANVVLLADPGLALYATAGSLPRKKIQVPSQFTDAAIQHLVPSFYAGPVLAADEQGEEVLMLPPPEVQGYTAAFHHLAPDTTANAQSAVPTWGLTPMHAMPPLGDLPTSRVRITEGWIQLTRSGA